MKEEEMKIKAGKPYEELTTEEKALIVDFTEEEHTELKLKYGKRLKPDRPPEKKHPAGYGKEKG